MKQRRERYTDQPATQALLQDGAYTSTTKLCDIIMKGGITSGVVYPLAVCELARTYQFKSIGGASAGAIAAAGAAAAELGRQRLLAKPENVVALPATLPPLDTATTGQPVWRQGFAGLAQLPDWIGSDGNLLSLFQPQDKTSRLFNLLIAGIGRDQGRIRRILRAVLSQFTGPVALGLLPGLILAISAVAAGGVHIAVGSIAAVALMFVGMFVAVALAIVRILVVDVPANRFGICSGLDGRSQRVSPPLTTWLSNYLNALAGKPLSNGPLTFGDLWGGDDVDPEDRNIDLQVMTTCLTLTRPYRMPFESQRFSFNRSDFEALFPPEVVTWMVDHPGPGGAVNDRPGFHPMPAAADLPVVVAARMSLSFPILFSAVPLYAVDFTTPERSGGREPEPCWFSDGGITSNLPVHFFDAPLPRWPTFAINLKSFEVGVARDQDDERNNVYFPSGNAGGQLEGWTRFEPSADTGTRPGLLGRLVRLLVPSPALLTAFFGSIFETMHNWVDGAQIRQPGYRDRTIHIKLDNATEGGLNLNMPTDVTDVLGERGRVAGIMLRDRFSLPPADPSAPSWDNHRWIRYRTLMASLERMLEGLARGSVPLPPDRTYEALAARTAAEAPASYRWKREAQRVFARERTAELLALARDWVAEDRTGSLVEGAPNPRGDLRQMPHL